MGSITKAAQSYHISQQGMSRAISQLEKSYGVVLFERKGNAIALTEAGRVFLKEVEPIIQAHNHLNSAIARFEGGPRGGSKGLVRVMMTLNVAFNIWPALSKPLHERCPRIEFSVHEMWQRDIIQELGSSTQGDSFSLVTLPSTFADVFGNPSLEFVPLLDIELMACVAKTSRFAKRAYMSIADLRTARLALFDDPGLLLMIKKIMGVDELDERNFIQTNNPSLLEDEVMENEAVTFGNTFVKRYAASSKYDVLPLERTFKTPMYLAYNRQAPLTDSVERVFREIRRIVREQYGEIAFSDAGRGDPSPCC